MIAPLAAAVVCLAVLSCGSGTTPLAPQQQQAWLDRLVPLPREIAMVGVVEVPAAAVCVRARAGAGPAEQTAAAQLAALLPCPHRPGAGQPHPDFEIIVGALDTAGQLEGLDLADVAARLRALPNPDQAYAIRPLDSGRLVLAGLTGRGAYYAAQTLRQLLDGPAAEGRTANSPVAIPLVTVTDWPALDQRGLWEGVFSRTELEWMASLKLSTVNVHARLRMTDGGRGAIAPDLVRRLPAGIEPDYVSFCRAHAIHCVPIVTHLSHLSRSGLYDHHPELRGEGDSARHPTKSSWIGPCTHEPALARVLGEWMAALAAEHRADEVTVWLSEEQVRCGCERCVAMGQYVGETRAILAGWRQARQRHPGLKLQILLTQGSYATNGAVLAEIAAARARLGDAANGADVRVVYYDGGRTYDASREPMIYPLLEQYAAAGGWLGVYPQVTASWAFVLPWSAPHLVRARMGEFASKGLEAVIGYAVPEPLVHDFNVAALAEWSWNPEGRSPAGFARAWATRRGFDDPGAVAAWADLLGPVGWDVYGSKFPLWFVWDDPAVFIRTHTRPRLGEYTFRYFPTAAHFDAALDTCARALEMARLLAAAEPDNPLAGELVQETLVTEGYVRLLQGLYHLSDGLAPLDAPTAAQVQLSRAHLDQMAAARDQINEALRAWAPGRGVVEVSRFEGTLGVNDRIVTQLGAVVDSLGAAAAD